MSYINRPISAEVTSDYTDINTKYSACRAVSRTRRLQNDNPGAYPEGGGGREDFFFWGGGGRCMHGKPPVENVCLWLFLGAL